MLQQALFLSQLTGFSIIVLPSGSCKASSLTVVVSFLSSVTAVTQEMSGNF